MSKTRMTVRLSCPECGSTDLEMRGEQRVYGPLDANGEPEGWSSGEITWDANEAGDMILYCDWCDHETTKAEADPVKRLSQVVRAALEGDSNDAEHDALVEVSVILGIEWEPSDD